MKNKRFEYPGKTATVSWESALCIHIGECGRAKGELFVGGRKPWCQPDLAPDDDVADVVKRCPTGALYTHFSDKGREETSEPVNTINVAYNGPLFVRGDLAIDGAPEDIPGLRYRAALCRCGQSKNKPYCDNSHLEAGFQDYGAIGDAGDHDGEQGGKLSISAAPNGPLIVSGNLTMTASSGRSTWQGKKAALCRCGASENKPFCDGSHVKAGFKSDD